MTFFVQGSFVGDSYEKDVSISHSRNQLNRINSCEHNKDNLLAISKYLETLLVHIHYVSFESVVLAYFATMKGALLLEL